MRSICTVAVLVELGLLITQLPVAIHAQQPAKKSTSAEPAALTPEEREAQKHYRIALEALKNGDLATASDELTSAAELTQRMP